MDGVFASARRLNTGNWRSAKRRVGYERGEKFHFSSFGRNGVRLNPVVRYESVEHVLCYAAAVQCASVGLLRFTGIKERG